MVLGSLLVYEPLKNNLGFTRTRNWPIPLEKRLVLKFSLSFVHLGINIKQLYGQTEATVFICATTRWRGEMADTVGKMAPGVELKIADDG